MNAGKSVRGFPFFRATLPESHAPRDYGPGADLRERGREWSLTYPRTSALQRVGDGVRDGGGGADGLAPGQEVKDFRPGVGERMG